MRLLVVEDEKKAGEYLKKGLEESGFTVDIATNGIDGLHHALEEDYALIVLDIMLPGMDGWEVLKRLRAKRDTPVLFLTAMDELEERVRGLELGAYDYHVKPFAFVELLAPIRLAGGAGRRAKVRRLKRGGVR